MNIHKFLPALFFAVCIYLLNIRVDIMDVDAAQYASMGREMLERGDYLHVYDRGNDYLDKPPFIFWITALSYNFFGIGNFGFKFPAILFSLLGIFAVYRFTKLWYDRETAALAALFLGLTQGYFHFTNDVRTDVYLTNAVILTIWMLSEQYRKPQSFWWIGAFIFAGIGMLAKGPLGLVAPALAFGTHVLMKWEFRVLLNWRWYAGLFIVALVLTPMIIGLYEQFDAQPNKLVNGRTGVSGLRFYFWEQSFGRITGENVWKNDSGPFFFVHSFAWSFLPWTPLFLWAFFDRIRLLVTRFKLSLVDQTEWISFGGFILPFVALSFSKYKLPHYIYVVFPMAAVIAAVWFVKIYREGNQLIIKRTFIFQLVLLALVWVLALVIFLWFFPIQGIFEYLAGITGLFAFIYFAFGGKFLSWQRLIFCSLAVSLSINVLLAVRFYPEVLNYQAGGKIGRYMLDHQISPKLVYNYKAGSRALDVYAQATIRDMTDSDLDSLMHAEALFYVYTSKEGLAMLKTKSTRLEVVKELPDFSVTLLRMNFGNPQKRPETLRPRYFVKMN